MEDKEKYLRSLEIYCKTVLRPTEALTQLLDFIVRLVKFAADDAKLTDERTDSVMVEIQDLALSDFFLNEFVRAAQLFPVENDTPGVWPGNDTVAVLKELLRPYQTTGELPSNIQIVAQCNVKRPPGRRPKSPMLGWNKNSPWRNYSYPLNWRYAILVPLSA